MDEMTAFENQLADELGQMAGPGRRIDGMAMVGTVATQSSRGGFGSMFSATKFVVAGAIVALFGGFLLAGVLTQPSEKPAPAATASEAGTFSSAGTLAERRFGNTATLLPDGRVLVVGGESMGYGGDPGLDEPAFAQVWDPETASFSPAGALVEARSDHTATLLPDGRVLIVGGFQYDHVALAEVWDPETTSFSPAGSLVDTRDGHTATLLRDGRVLVVEGRLAEVWDPETASFSPAGSLRRARSDHTATLLPDGRVLVFGGDYAGNDVVPAEVWDPEAEWFSPAGSSFAYTPDGYAGSGFTVTPLPDGEYLIVGGGYVNDPDGVDERVVEVASAAVWDPETESLDGAGSLTEGREGHTATLLPDGRVLVVGGTGSDGYNLVSAEVWDAETASFSPAGSLADERWGHTATLLPDGRVLVLGGVDGSDDPLVSAEIWEPRNG